LQFLKKYVLHQINLPFFVANDSLACNSVINANIFVKKHNKLIRIISLLAFIFFYSYCSIAQIEKANELYKKGLYSSAIPLYIKELKEKYSLAIDKKIVNCYIKLNKTQEAEARLAAIISTKDTSSELLLQFAELLVMNGKCDSLDNVVYRIEKTVENESRILKIKQQCSFLLNHQPVYQNVDIQPFEYNSDADENSPIIYKNHLYYSSDRSTGTRLLKKTSETTGRDFLSIYESTRLNDSTWKIPEKISSKINELNINVSGASFTKDGKKFYFSKNSQSIGRNDVYYLQLFEAEYDGGGFKHIKKLPFCIDDANYMHPMVSPDGSYLFYTSDRGNGHLGETDIYFVKKGKKGWGRPANLGEIVNTKAAEGFPFFNSKNELYFCSKGHEGLGGFDIFRSKLDTSGNWSKPINVGLPFNGASDDVGICFDSTEKNGVFVSSRNGRADDMFLFKIIENESKEIETPDQFKCDQTHPITNFKLIFNNLQFYPNSCFRIENIFIENTDKINLDKSNILADLVNKLIESPTLIVEIQAFYKFDAEAKKMSELRAKSLATYLIDQGVSPSKLFWKGMGSMLYKNEELNNPISKMLAEQVLIKIVKI